MKRHLRLALIAARVVLGGLFVYAAATKVPNMDLFAEETANYRMLPAALVPVFSAGLVGVELLAGLLLIAGRWVRAAGAVLSVLLVAFIVGLSQALLRGIDLRCGCFGGVEPATWMTVARDAAMLLPALALWRWGERQAASGGAGIPRQL